MAMLNNQMVIKHDSRVPWSSLLSDDWDDTPGDPGGTEGKGMPFETLIYII